MTTRDDYWDLEIGRVYTVYGLALGAGVLGYMLDVNNDRSPGTDYPLWFPASFFEILNSALPEDFHAYYLDNVKSGRSFGGVTFRAWADSMFYDSLTDGDEVARDAWHAAKREIDELAEMQFVREPPP